MYWDEFKTTIPPTPPEHLRQAKERAIKKVNDSLRQSKLEAEPLTKSIVMHEINRIDGQQFLPIYMFRIELKIHDLNKDQIYREALSSDRYQGFYLYIIDILGETCVLDWTPEQTSRIMSDLTQVRADPIECVFLSQFLTIEHYGRGGNRQIERLFADTLEVEELKDNLSSSSHDKFFNLLLHGSVRDADKDIDHFTTNPEKTKESFFSIPARHRQALKEGKYVFEVIEDKIQQSLCTQREAKENFAKAAEANDFQISLDFTYVSVIDETIIIRRYSLPSLEDYYNKQEIFYDKSTISDCHLVDNLINKSRCEVREIPGSIKVLCTQKDKISIDSSKLMEMIYKENAKEESGIILIANYVTGDGKIRLNEGVSRTIIFEDIDFHGDVVLDGANFCGSVTFRRCRFLAQLSAKDASIEGSLTIQRCILHGSASSGLLHTAGEGKGNGKRKSTLVAHGLSVAKSFFITSSTIFGRVKGQWLQVGNILELRDTQIYEKENNSTKEADTKQDLVKLSYARVGGPVVLTSSLDNYNVTLIRGYIGGHCLLPGLKADSLHIGGLFIDGSLDLEAARIQSTLAIEKLTIPGGPCSGWLTHIGHDLILNYAHCELLRMADVHILGKLTLEEAEIEHSCKMAASYDSGGRCIIHGDAVLDGAIIKGDISMRGAHIGGDLSLITGNFGRIHANATWIKIPPPENHWLDILETEIYGNIYLADCKMGSLALVGIKVRHSIITNNLLINGRIRFWGPKRKDTMKKEATDRAGQQIDNDLIEEMINGITADISGDINLANAKISGGIDFSKLIAESINLDGATLEGGLSFHVNSNQGHPVKIKNGVSLKGITINGELDARGLRIARGDFNAKDSSINGEIIFANRDGQENETLILEVGNIELEGLAAPALWVSDSCLVEGEHKNSDSHFAKKNQEDGGENKARTINLSRTNLGQLTVYGLWQKEGLSTELNLYAAKIEDWNLVNKKGEEDHQLCLALLSATNNHFDARNYLDIENRLHAIGRTSLSNRVYREMGININRKNSSRNEGDYIETYDPASSRIYKSLVRVARVTNTTAEKIRGATSHFLKSHNTFIQLIAFILTPLIALIGYFVVRPLSSISKLLLGELSIPIRRTNTTTSEALHRTSDGFLFNWIFTHGRTKPELMFLWLFLLALPAIVIACDQRNIIAPHETVSAQGTSPYDAYRTSHIEESDDCPATYHVNKKDWNIAKSIGVATTYAVPFYQSAKIDKAKLRTTGCTYVWRGMIASVSPHDIPQIFSILQFALWILIAANLPAIIRRRS